MAQNSANVAAASPVATGGMLIAPLGTPLPTSAAGSLDAAFVPLGYIGADGLQNTGDAAQSEDVFAWGGDLVATLQTVGSIKRYTSKLIEFFNPDVSEFLYGADNVTVTAAAGADGTKIDIADKGEEIDRCSVIYDMRYQGKRARVVVPIGQPQVTGEDPFVHTAIAGTDIQVTCFKDESGNRQYLYLVNDDIAEES